MAIAEMYINTVDDKTVSIDLSPDIAGLADPETAFGFAYTKTLEHLGFERERVATDWLPRLLVRGDLQTAHRHLPDLHRHIGLIARYGVGKGVAFHGYNRDIIGRQLGELADRTIPNLAAGAALSDVAFTIAYPFAKEVKGGGDVRGHARGCKAPWLATDTELAVRKKKEELSGRLVCVPMEPAKDPAEELLELNTLPDQTSWWERWERKRQVQDEAAAIALLQARGFTIAAPAPETGVA